MILLAIETTTERASIALSVNGVLYQDETLVLRQHAQWLLPAIERLLQQAGIALKQVEGIAFGRGPGSFTGLRIGCSMAKGLAYGLDCPLYPVSSLEAVALAQPPAHPVLAVIDARMHQVYWACFSDGQAITPEQVSNPDAVQLPGNAPFVLVGAGFEAYQTQWCEDTRARLIEARTIYPHAATLIARVTAGAIQPVSANEAAPVYIRNQVTQGEPRG